MISEIWVEPQYGHLVDKDGRILSQPVIFEKLKKKIEEIDQKIVKGLCTFDKVSFLLESAIQSKGDIFGGVVDGEMTSYTSSFQQEVLIFFSFD